MPEFSTNGISPEELEKQKWLDFLNNREIQLAKAVEVSRMMQSELNSMAFDDIKKSLARSLNISPSQINFFGSRLMGVANVESDLDIYIEMEGSFHKGLSKEKQQLYLDDFKVKLRSNRDWQNLFEVRDATVPILHLDYVGNATSLKCEISVCDGIAVSTSKLMAHLFELQPNAIKFFHFIRIWLKSTDVEFKGFQLAVLVIFFLQTRIFIPGVSRLQKKRPAVEIRGWKVHFNAQLHKCNTWVYFKRSVLRFFAYYREFDYERSVIFPHLGVPVDKMNYAIQPLLLKLPQDKTNFQNEKPMAASAPLACDYNITQDVSDNKLAKFKDVCRRSIVALRPVQKF